MGLRSVSFPILLGSWMLLSVALAQETPPKREGSERIRELIRRLGADSWTTRNEAARALGRIGSPAFEPLHRASFTAPDPEIRHHAKLILAGNLWKGLPADLAASFRGFFQKPDREKVAALRDLLDSVRVLGAEGGKVYLERAFLYDPTPEVRKAALEYMDEAGVLLAPGVLRNLAEARSDPWSRHKIGLAFSRNGFAEEALELLLSPEVKPASLDFETASALAESLRGAGRAEEGVPYGLRAMELGEEDPEFDPFPAMRTLIAGGNPGKGLETYPFEATEMETRMRLAVELSAAGLIEEAAGLLKFDVGEEEAVLLARIHARAGKGKEALRVLEHSIESFGYDGPGVLVTARALGVRGWSKEVLERLAPSKELEFSPLSVVLERARLLDDLGRGEDAAALLIEEGTFKAFRYGSRGPWRGASEMLFRLGKPDEALRILKAARSEDPDDPDVLVAAGEVLESAGREGEALDLWIEVFHKLQDLEDHVRLTERILHLASRTGGLDPLVRRLEGMAEGFRKEWLVRIRTQSRWAGVSDENRVPILCLVGRIHAVLGRVDASRKALNRAWELASHSLETMVLLDRMEAEQVIRDAESEWFFRIMLAWEAGEAMDAEPGAGESLRFLWFCSRFCDPKWEEAVFPGVSIDSHQRFSRFLRGVLPGGVPVPEALNFPAFGKFLWDQYRGAFDYRPHEILEWPAISALSKVGGDMAARTLARISDRGEGTSRETALAGLETFPSAQAAPLLLQMMKRGVGEFRWQCRVAGVLARSSLGPVRRELVAMTAEPMGRLKLLAAWILVRKGESGYSRVLEEVAGNRETPAEARRFAVLALAPHGQARHRSLFSRFAASPDARLRMAGAVGLALLGDPEGTKAIVRELEWAARHPPAGLGPALEAASIVGGKGLGVVLARSVFTRGMVGEEALNSLVCMGGPGTGNWRRVLDMFPFGEGGEGGFLGPFLDVLAAEGEPEDAREGLACLLENFVPGSMGGLDLARASRLARKAGEKEAAERFFHAATRRLCWSRKVSEREAFTWMLCDFGREPARALELARRVRKRLGWTVRAVSLEAHALHANGKREEALRLLDDFLSDFPCPGRPRLVRLRERIAAK